VGANEQPGFRLWTVEDAAEAQRDQLNWIEKEIARVLAVIVVKKARLAEREGGNGEGGNLRSQVH
jgi:hypothetical protein